MQLHCYIAVFLEMYIAICVCWLTTSDCWQRRLGLKGHLNLSFSGKDGLKTLEVGDTAAKLRASRTCKFEYPVQAKEAVKQSSLRFQPRIGSTGHCQVASIPARGTNSLVGRGPQAWHPASKG